MRLRSFSTLGFAGAAALVLLAVAAPGAADASTVVIGGQAEACSVAAKAGRYDAPSLEACTQAITGEPLHGHELAATYVNRGTMYIAALNYLQAMRDMNDALAIEPNLAEAFVNRGGAMIGLRRYREAVDEINKGLALNPSEPEKAYGNRALAKWSLDDLKGAYQDFLKAQELKPDWTWVAEQLTAFKVTPVAK